MVSIVVSATTVYYGSRGTYGLIKNIIIKSVTKL